MVQSVPTKNMCIGHLVCGDPRPKHAENYVLSGHFEKKRPAGHPMDS